jgi:hypothetical protein
MPELDWQQIETILETLNSLPERTVTQERLRAELQEAHDNAAEEYWSSIWAG